MRKSDIDSLPKNILGAAWKPQKERMDAGIFIPLFIVTFVSTSKFAIYLLPTDFQTEKMFIPRLPLTDKAKKPGWTGYTIDLEHALSPPQRLYQLGNPAILSEDQAKIVVAMKGKHLNSKIFFTKQSKKIAGFPDSSQDSLAADRLAWLKETYKSSIPSNYLDNWGEVKLYSASGEVKKAFGLVLDIEDGAYDVRNSLNDLTGKNWVKFTSSWFLFNAKPSDIKEEKAISPEIASHPATFSPSMIEDFIRFFTKEGMTVLDPFSGIGSTVVAAKRNKRFGIGIELNPKYATLSQLRISPSEGRIIQGNSMKISELDLPEIDFSISSPPYWDVLNRSTKDFKNERTAQDLDVSYSDSIDDLGNMPDYEKFLDAIESLYSQIYDKCKPGAYNVVIVKNVKKDGVMYPLAWDIARRLSNRWQLKDEKIWIQDQVSLAPYGYPHGWASNIIHHYCLIFQKAK